MSKSILLKVFGSEFLNSLCSKNVEEKLLDGPSLPKSPRTEELELTKNLHHHLPQQMLTELSKLEESERLQLESIQQEGRLGPKIAKFDVASHVGSFIISTDRLGVSSQCNFGSLRASCCVYKGMWQYEVQLGSNGVMQVGWATLETKFSQEKGVGDTVDSYSFDGNRVRKWNKSTAQYGEAWQSGDIIGCCIDMDEGNIEYFRNGRSLGVAFTDIRRGSGVAYFPAVSLAYQENVVANFGATPLQFPIAGYSPLQTERNADNNKSALLLSWLEKLLPLYKNKNNEDNQSLLLITNRVMEFLGPHLHSGFVVEQSFFPFLNQVLGIGGDVFDFEAVLLLLDTMWTFLEESELKSCFTKICVVLMNQFRSNSMSLDYPQQRSSLLCLISLMKHRKTRRHFLRSLLFDRSGRIFHFLHVRPMEETVLKDLIPTWDENNAEAKKLIQSKVLELQRLQVDLLKLLLSNDDGSDKSMSSRALFLKKFRCHLRDVVRPGSVLHQPIQKAMCTFFSLLTTIHELYSEEIENNEEINFPSIPSSLFYDTSISYFDMERIGGLQSYLYKTYHTEISTKLSIPDYINAHTEQEQSASSVLQPTTSANSEEATAASSIETVTPTVVPQFGAVITGTPSGHNMLIPMLAEFRGVDQGFTLYPGGPGFVGFASVEQRSSTQPQNPAVSLLGKDSGMIDPLFSLRELLDDAIIVFNSGVQSNIEKVVAVRSTMEGYELALKEAQIKANARQGEHEELSKSIEIFTAKLEQQSRHMAWIEGAIFTPERQGLVHSLLRVVLRAIQSASEDGPIFTFLPEHYITTLISLNNLLLTQFPPTVPLMNISNIKQTHTELATFVATHFADPRIVVAETKDALTQALSTFICNHDMLLALENMSTMAQLQMVKSILRPYENRAWAQSNWMLVRLWQGSEEAFGFEYPNCLESRRCYRAKPVQDEFGISTNLAPSPSYVFQSHIANVLLEDQKFAVAFLHSVLNQLNWAFSEFVGLLQEIQTASNRPERVFVETRQLKICSTCFELSFSLLRVLEMIVCIANPVLCDFTRESAEPLLGRLAMLLSQVLNRIGCNTTCFANIVELDVPGLENVTYFPVLSAVAGILVALIRPEIENEEDRIPTTKCVLGEPSFQVNSLDFFIGRNQSNLPPGRSVFSLQSYVPTDLTETELNQLTKVINHLYEWSEKLHFFNEIDTDPEQICTICYAYPKNATLKPCNHRTCRTCILHHLMNRGDCFFCKATILSVVLDDGSVVHEKL